MKLSIETFKPVRKGALLGFATVILPEHGMRLHDVGIFTGATGPWASAPSKPRLGADGRQVVGTDGRRVFDPAVDFVGKADRDTFSRAVIDAVRALHPEVVR